MPSSHQRLERGVEHCTKRGNERGQRCSIACDADALGIFPHRQSDRIVAFDDEEIVIAILPRLTGKGINSRSRRLLPEDGGPRRERKPVLQRNARISADESEKLPVVIDVRHRESNLPPSACICPADGEEPLTSYHQADSRTCF